MAKDFGTLEDSNTSANPTIHELCDPERRLVLRGGFVSAVGGLLAPGAPWFAPAARLTGVAAAAGASLVGCATPASLGPAIGFKAVPASAADGITVAEGYIAQPFAAWGEPVGVPGNLPAFKDDASNSAAEQEVQMGMHHDGLHFYPIDGSSTRGLLAMNHEYTDDGLLHAGGMVPWTAEKVRKSQAAHGLAVIEVELNEGRWRIVQPSKFARRVTMNTPFTVGGPAAGHTMMKTAADPAGMRVLGTLNNCASGKTPLGTYLSGEENFSGYFIGSA